MNFDDYKVTVPYPERPRRPRLDAYTADSINAHSVALVKWGKAQEAYLIQKRTYSDAQTMMLERFKTDVLKEYGLEGHPKADKVFAMAWEEGHSAGYSEVAMWVEQLAELVL